MKLLQISNYYPPHVGGIEQVAHDCAAALAAAGVEQRVFCFHHERGDRCDEADGETGATKQTA